MCSVEGCDKPPRNRNGSVTMCRMHQLRLIKRGDIHFTYTGKNHWSWSGDTVTYSGAHQRVNRVRGRADAQGCIDCPSAAAHWSYTRSGVGEIVDERGIPYSSDPTQYEPRCVPCHKKFDLAHVRA